MKLKTLLLLFLILFLAAFLRFWKIGEVPISPDWDEAALGYNAYSIMQTGRDEYGKFMPIILRSFDDYKPALYTYLTIPAIGALGLNTTAVRLPSVVFGILTVLTTYFLVKELFKKESLAILSAFLLAVSPWHIQFSRIAFEANVGMALNALCVLFFIKALKNPKFLLLSSLFAGLSLHVYQSEKVFVPLLLLALFVIFRREFLAIPKKYIFSSVAIGILLSLPLLWFILTSKEALLRARGVSIFSDQTPFLSRTTKKLENDALDNDKLGLILDNRRFTYGITTVSGYLSHFDLNWLFIKGDLARHHAPEMGLLYLFELPFLFIGLYMLAFGNFEKKIKIFIVAWFLLVPVPASITTGVPHPIRTLNFLPLWQIFVALGILTVFKNLKLQKSFIKYPVISFLSIIFIFNFVYYLDQYFVQQNYFSAKYWEYGYEKIVPQVNGIKGVEKVIVSNAGDMDQSYMFFLFYLKYPPRVYQHEITRSGGFKENHKFGKYEFRPIVWDKEKREEGIIYVGTPYDFQGAATSLYSVYYPDGSEAMRIVR